MGAGHSHGLDRALEHTCNESAPAGVRGTEYGARLVGEQHWQTIGHLDRQHDARCASDRCIGDGTHRAHGCFG